MPARRDPAPLRRRRRRPAAVLECCDVCTPSLSVEAPPPDPVEIENLDDAIIAVAGGARPGRRAHHLRRDPPRLAQQEDPAQLVRRAAGVRRVVAHAARRHPRARGRADRGGQARDDGRPLSGAARRRVSFRIAVLVSGEGSNLQALIDELRRLATSRSSGVASSRAEARGLRARGGRPASRPPCSRSPTSRTGPSATTRWRAGSKSAGSSWWCWPASWSCSRPASFAASRAGSSTSTRRSCPPFRGSARSSRRSSTG